jgi:hypothetical protein
MGAKKQKSARAQIELLAWYSHALCVYITHVVTAMLVAHGMTVLNASTDISTAGEHSAR